MYFIYKHLTLIIMTAKDKALEIYTSIHNNTSGKLSEVSKILTAI